MRIAIGCDHAGYRMKRLVVEHLTEAGHDVLDVGTDSVRCSTTSRFIR